MLHCPFFECLAYSPANCEQHPACEGCKTFSSCVHCARQEALVDGVRVPCEHKAAREAGQQAKN